MPGGGVDEREQKNSTDLPVLMVDHNVMRFHVAVHDALAVAVIQRFQELVDIVSHIDVVELGVEAAEVGVVDILEDERWCLALLFRLG